MNVSNGVTHLEFERGKGTLQVRLASTQFKEGAVRELPETVSIKEEEEAWVLSYAIPENARSLKTALLKANSPLEKLKLAQKLANLSGLSGRFEIPFLHPENIFLEGESIFVVHFGLQGLVAPQELTQPEFLKEYKALIFTIFNSKNSFESLLDGGTISNDNLSQAVAQCESVSEIVTFINHEVEAETVRVTKKQLSVSKGRYRFFKYFGIFAIAITLVLSWFSYYYYSNAQKQTAIITAQTHFLTTNYAQTQTDLQEYSPKSLPKSARYILAVSSINLSDLTIAQKQSILATVSIKSDNNTLDYWVYTGRGDFGQALDLAQNLGDNQLTLLAYTNLYETTKLNTTMNGAKKQELLDQYNKHIQELSKSLGN